MILMLLHIHDEASWEKKYPQGKGLTCMLKYADAK